MYCAEVTEPGHLVADYKKQFAEPDGWVETQSEVIIIEVKLTGGPAGQEQAELLYKPLLEFLLGKPVRCLMVCRNITGVTPEPRVGSFEEFLLGDQPFAVWHHLT